MGARIAKRAPATDWANGDLNIFASDIEGVAILERDFHAVGAFDEGGVDAGGDFAGETQPEDAALVVFIADDEGGGVGVLAPGAPSPGLHPF